MKVKFNKTTTEEMEIPLPCFVKYGDLYTKVIGKDNLLIVEDWGYGDKGIIVAISSQRNPFGNDGWVFITENEFNKVLLSVYEKLTQFIPVETA